MDKKEIISELRRIKPQVQHVYGVTQILKKTGVYKEDYEKYMSSDSSINIDEELARLDGADYDLACAILTALMREGYFCGENWFQRRVKNGLFDKAIGRVISLLEESL